MTRSIYVISSDPGPVKIGIAGEVSRRLSTLRTASAVPLHLAFAGETDDDVRSLEKHVHMILSSHRLNGEWFDITAEHAVSAVLEAADELGMSLVRKREQQAPPEMDAAQLRAARALLKMEQRALAEAANVPVQTLKRYEGSTGPLTGNYQNISSLIGVLEAAGIIFLADGETTTGGAGVRLR